MAEYNGKVTLNNIQIKKTDASDCLYIGNTPLMVWDATAIDPITATPGRWYINPQFLISNLDSS